MTLKSTKPSNKSSRKATNSRMYIVLNGIGTALYGPRSEVTKFIEVGRELKKTSWSQTLPKS